ncbi:MAG: signal peptide peptidase SppA [Alistipes sp.]|nr:signal peptide peptidase SppA [Alistipes sp.]
MEENKLQTESNGTHEIESAPAPQQEVKVEAEQSAAQPTPKPAPKQRKPQKKSSLTFGTVFLASLLAVVAGSVVTVLFWVFVFSGISTIMAPEVKSVPDKAILHINLAESLVDAPSKNPMGTFDLMSMTQTSQLTIYDALRALESAAKDERIEGIYINMVGGGSANMTLLEELRAAIIQFKQSGKWVVAYNETYSQGVYYISSVADKVYMQPEGTFDWSGLEMSTIFFKGLFDKLGIKVDILRPTACKYKSAVEPYFLTEMSDENREQMQELADHMWGVIVDGVAESRGVSAEELNRLADELAVVLPSQALEHKLIDGVKYADQMEALFEEEYGIEEPEYISLGDYASSLITDPKRASAPKVAIVYANGDVIDGSGSDDNIYGYTLSQTLREVAEDDDIKSVVLRVNSPGGSALASDLIWREMENLKAKKPVIVSMGSYAASGGYYISAPADAIVADRSTLTGSIGVFGMMPSYGDALEDKLGITVDAVKTNANAGMGNGFEALSSTQYRAMMQGVDRVYERFTSLVAEGRNLTIERVLEIAEGRVWSGEQAQKIGLVDTCGGLTSALAIAIDKAELGDNYQVVEVMDEADGWMAMLNSLGVKARQAMTSRSELGELYNEYRRLEQMVGKEGIYTVCPYIFRF